MVEIGTFTGATTIAMARCLHSGGTVHTFDASTEQAEDADRTWRAAGAADRSRQHIGPAALLFAG
ncbi:class I SAM-dependent methyltransferase [Lentzea sp. NPDC059081]|uniref:class I SAM-dependent methyltransferase n=1 Tax=Lentzea sp. NPDC059081 TaxID=3346719 RepID=UPI003683C3A3